MSNKPARILLIDDEEKLVRGLAEILEEAGYVTLATTSGDQGLSLAATHQPDMIICDVTMPPPDGFQVREQLNHDMSTATIPFIFITARTDKQDRLYGIQAGADDYITKPFDVDELLMRIKAILRRAQLSRRQGQLEAQDQLQNSYHEILRNLTHELRTPISHIKLSLDLALEEKFGDAEAERLNFLLSAALNTERLRGLTDDLLFLAALDQGEVQAFRQEIHPQYHFTQPVQAVFTRWAEKKLRTYVNVAPSLTIRAPRDRFRQAVVHLIDNACKFSPKGGIVRVRLWANGPGGCILTVKDEGPGIPQDQREAVFKRYYQISRGDGRQYQGLGVGLTIAQAVAQTLGGNVEIVDVPQGCLVRMIIPAGELGMPEADSPCQGRPGEPTYGGANC